MLIEISAAETSDIIAACIIAERAGVILECHTPIMSTLPFIRAKLSGCIVDNLLQKTVCKYKETGRSLPGKTIVGCAYHNTLLQPECAIVSGLGECPIQVICRGGANHNQNDSESGA